MDTELEAIVRKLLRENKKIAAVKAVRERTNWGLRESKDFVDAIERGQPAPTPLSQQTLPPTRTPHNLRQEALRLLRGKSKIEAIKYVRIETNWGLKESKDFVDALERGQKPPIPGSPMPQTTTSGGLKDAAIELLRKDRKIEAIKIVRERTGWGLKESKDFVDALERGQKPPIPGSPMPQTTTSGGLKDAAIELLRKGRKIEAIKIVRERTGWGLKESKDFVDALEQRSPPAAPQYPDPAASISTSFNINTMTMDDAARALKNAGRKRDAAKLVSERMGWSRFKANRYVSKL